MSDFDNEKLRFRSTERVAFAVTDARAFNATPASHVGLGTTVSAAEWERLQQAHLKDWLKLKHGRTA